jgi:hypothetical protein
LKAEEGVGTEGEEGATGVHGYARLVHRIFASLRAGGAEGVYGVVAVVVAGGCTAGWDAAVAAAVGKTAVLAVGVVDHTGSGQQEPVALELILARAGERIAAQILQRPEADKECMVGQQVVVVAEAEAETAPVVHVADAVAVAVVVVVAAAVAIGSFVSHHNHNLRTEQIAPVEGAVVRVQALGAGQLATVGCTLAALEAELLLLL